MDELDFNSIFGDGSRHDDKPNRGYKRNELESDSEDKFRTPYGSEEDLVAAGGRPSPTVPGKYSNKSFATDNTERISPFETLDVAALLTNESSPFKSISQAIPKAKGRTGASNLFCDNHNDNGKSRTQNEAAENGYCTPNDDFLSNPMLGRSVEGSSGGYTFVTPSSSLPDSGSGTPVSQTYTPVQISAGTPLSFHSLNINNPEIPAYFPDIRHISSVPPPLPPVESSVGSSHSSGGEEEGKEEVKPFSFRRMTRNQKIIFVLMSLSDFTSFLCLSVPGPFYPGEGAQKGLNNTQTGWVFAVFSLAQFLFSPICGKLMSKVGSRFMFLAGNFFSGGCVIVFGVLDMLNYNDGGTVFLVFSVVTRIFMAMGCTASTTAAFAICINSFPDAISTILGVMETFTGLGMMLGPAIGGFLYEAGGYKLPFMVLGGTLLATVPLSFIMLPISKDKEEESNGSMWQLLKTPSGLIICITIMMSAVVWAALDPTLQPHLEEFDLSADIIGVIFLLSSAFYAITSPLWGKLADKMYDSKPLVIVGFLLTAICCMLLGSSTILGFPVGYHELWLDILSVSVMGLSVSMSVVPTFDLIMWVAVDAGMDDSIGTYGIVAGLWTSAYALGEFIGPVMGGYLLDQVNFTGEMDYLALSCVIAAVLAFLLWLYERCCKREDEEEDEDENIDGNDKENDQDDTNPLLVGEVGSISATSAPIEYNQFLGAWAAT